MPGQHRPCKSYRTLPGQHLPSKWRDTQRLRSKSKDTQVLRSYARDTQDVPPMSRDTQHPRSKSKDTQHVAPKLRDGGMQGTAMEGTATEGSATEGTAREGTAMEVTVHPWRALPGGGRRGTTTSPPTSDPSTPTSHHPTPHTQHPTPYTLHPKPYTRHPTAPPHTLAVSRCTSPRTSPRRRQTQHVPPKSRDGAMQGTATEGSALQASAMQGAALPGGTSGAGCLPCPREAVWGTPNNRQPTALHRMLRGASRRTSPSISPITFPHTPSRRRQTVTSRHHSSKLRDTQHLRW